MKIDFAKTLYYAELSQLSYKSDKEILAKFPNAIIKEVTDLELKAFIIPDDKNKIYWIVCRGTANFLNAKLDIKYKKTTHNLLYVPIHEGFYKSALAIYDKIIRDIPNNSYRIRLTGHSLGGAIAAILMILLSKTRIIDNCVTLGQPKFCTKALLRKYKHLLPLLLRVVADEDPVPLVPPLTLFSFFDHGPFRHFGKEILLLEEDSYEYLNEKNAEGIFLSSFWLHLGHENIKAHFMDNYLKNLKIKTAGG
jgi:triacylglycerol lipase